MATSISLWLQFCTLLFYIVFLKVSLVTWHTVLYSCDMYCMMYCSSMHCVVQKGESTWPGWSKECLRDWWPFVKLAVPSECSCALWGMDFSGGGGESGGVGGLGKSRIA